MDKSIDAFFGKASKWKEEYAKLRTIAQATDLIEDFKWGKPCYTFNGGNVVLIHGFKDYCALLFHKGVLLKDPDDILVQQTENVQAARQLRFTSSEEIEELEPTIKTYIQDAIEVEKSGEEVEMKKTKEFDVPDEFQEKLDENPKLKTAFENLTAGRQRGYLLYFSGAKQSKTRKSRVEKYTPHILDGKGKDD